MLCLSIYYTISTSGRRGPGQMCGTLPLRLDAVQLGVIAAPIRWDPPSSGEVMEKPWEKRGFYDV
jgi:hypothetical protein